MTSYSPRDFRALTWHDATPAFAAGTDTPRAYLERCLETISAREPVVQAWVAMNEAGAREAADASTSRWKLGGMLSAKVYSPASRPRSTCAAEIIDGVLNWGG